MSTTHYDAPTGRSASRPGQRKLVMHPRTRDVLNATAARAHADAEPNDRDAVARHGKSRRTWARARLEGPIEVRAFQTYVWASPDPYRLVAETKTTAKHRVIARLSDAELIERYIELRPRDKRLEAEDSADDFTRGVPWLDRSASSERDAAVNEEKAACEREFACRGIGEERVLGRLPS